ncbi:UPF0481 protein At3g47200-like [Rhododendron vialii]|uniref:UPF0481 protein At3g47200-like n=1 Tax=Rhododendron vialii TaxID=182163 RepID=UPI0026604FED|nr:UPF0481 protein At3g47200-like [Rhododendron vialii]
MELEIHPTEMSQGEEALQRLTSTVVEKIGVGAQKTEFFFSSACIYRVPEKLRKLKESTYTPHLIAIGPLHQNDEHLQTPLQHVKMSYTKFLLHRLTAGMEGLELAERTKFVLQKCLAEIKTLIDDAKKCYAAEVTVLNIEEMLLVDGCFILEFLYRSRSLELKKIAEKEGKKPIDGGDNSNSKRRETTDPIFGNLLTLYHVKNDLILLENQIPFFVLEKLFSLTVGQIPNRPDKNWSLTDYVGSCYAYKKMSSPVGKSANAKTRCSPSDCVLGVLGSTTTAAAGSTAAAAARVQSGKNIDHYRSTAKHYHHILHNLHDGYLRVLPSGYGKLISDEEVLMPSALDLNYRGVQFVADASGNHGFKFTEPKGLFSMWRRACFEVPPLSILDDTELYLRNLITFEQCCPGVSPDVTSYAYIMSMLVNTDKDVQALEQARVVINYLGARKDATNLLTSLCKETALGELIFADTCIKATRYSNRRWAKNMAACRYFVAPWTFRAFVTGFISFAMYVFYFVRKFLKKEKWCRWK